MEQIGLNLEILNQVEYHWFYGLVLTKNKTLSLGSEIEEIFNEIDEKSQSKKIIQIENEFNHFVRLSFFYRNILWLFSSSIRKNYYLRSAIYSYLVYEYPWIHSSDYNSVAISDKHKQALNQGYLFIEHCPKEYVFFNQMMMLIIKKGDYIFSKSNSQQSLDSENGFLPTGSPKKVKPMDSDMTSVDTLIEITPDIQISLKVLDLDCKIGESISLSDITKAYKRKALKTHPDKNKAEDAGQQFILIKDAYENILKHIRGQHLDYDDDLATLLYQILRELEESYQKIKSEVDATLMKAEECIAEAESLQAKARSYIANRNAGIFYNQSNDVEEQANEFSRNFL